MTTRTLGSVVRAERERRGLSVRALAKLVDVQPSHILRIEDGSRGVSDALMRRLAKALKLRVADLEALALATTPLPRLDVYLRAKYDHLSDEALAELRQAFEDVAKKHVKRGKS